MKVGTTAERTTAEVMQNLVGLLLAESPNLAVLQNEQTWRAIKQHAARHGVAALVAYAARSSVSEAERSWCDRVLVESWARHERMLWHLEFVLGVLTRERIPAISLKGPLLAERYYAPAFLRRPSGDLDVAVAASDIDRACKALVANGYRQDVSTSDALQRSHHVTLSHAGRPWVELHFRLSHATSGIPVEQFFERTVPRCLPGGLEARVLGAADQLLHLALHLAHSRFGPLFYLYEVRRAYRAESAAVRTEALKLAIDSHFCGALRMIDLAFRVRLGEPFLSSAPEVPATWLGWRMDERLFRDFERCSSPGRAMTVANRVWGRWLDLQLTDRPSDAIRLATLFARTARADLVDKKAWRQARKRRVVPVGQPL